MRLDLRLVEGGQASTRTQAALLIRQGMVEVGGKIIQKPAYDVREDAAVNILKPLSYVSRGGYKLERALRQFAFLPKNMVCADIGASNGGFCDCLLQFGARKVYAVDVGECALPEPLKIDPRVVVKDRTNARFLSRQDLGEACDLVTIDVSFISLKLILPAVGQLLRPNSFVIALIKPQFEAGPQALSKNGIVRHPQDRFFAVCSVVSSAEEAGLHAVDLTAAPIHAGKNVEYLILLTNAANHNKMNEITPDCLKRLESEAK